MTNRVPVIALALACCAPPLHAQQTRQEGWEQQRAAKARALQPYKPGKIEAALLMMEEKRILERLTTDDGFYPRLRGLATGSGFAGGVGFRRHMWGDQALFRATGAVSTRAYKLIETEFILPRLVENRLSLGARVRYRDLPQEDFFGIGNDSSKAGRTNYLLEDTDYAATAAVRVRPWLQTGVRVGLLDIDIGRGTDPRFPSTERRFGESSAPGLERQPTFLYSTLFVDVDYRDEPGNARSGGYYHLSFANYGDRDFDRYSFGRLEGIATHFFPIFDKKRVFAVRGRVVFTNNKPGHVTPFYMLPTIGGSDTVRGFREYRFRDENAVFFNLEYRWEAFAGLDMALFFDAGEVRREWENIDLQRLKTSYGVGFRFNTYKSVFLRIDIGAGGREGTRYFVKFGPAF